MLARIEREIQHHGLFALDGSPMSFRTPRVWIALHARGGKEQDAADWLKKARMFAYWPCYAKDSNAGWRGRHGLSHRRVRYCSLLPGYLFIGAREGATIEPSHLVEQTPGIMGYIRDASGYPMTLGEQDIQTIRRIESGENLPPNPKTAHKFKIKDKVRFCDDLLGRWPHGLVERLADDGRISVGVPLLGRSVSVLAFPHQIEAM